MRHYGIIGKPLEHSYSAKYFMKKFAEEGIAADYQLYEIDNLDDISSMMHRLEGFNVTYPYKETILEHLLDIDTIAKQIGAVNVVSHGKGYNTDWIGFRDSIMPYLKITDKKVLVLGTGGVSKAVQYALQHMGLDYTLVSRTPTEGILGYEDINEAVLQAHTVLVNCTPLGMLPDVDSKPNLPYEYITRAHLMYDCVYNPECSAFLSEGKKRGACVVNGLKMLYLQADEAWTIWSKNQ